MIQVDQKLYLSSILTGAAPNVCSVRSPMCYHPSSFLRCCSDDIANVVGIGVEDKLMQIVQCPDLLQRCIDLAEALCPLHPTLACRRWARCREATAG